MLQAGEVCSCLVIRKRVEAVVPLIFLKVNLPQNTLVPWRGGDLSLFDRGIGEEKENGMKGGGEKDRERRGGGEEKEKGREVKSRKRTGG